MKPSRSTVRSSILAVAYALFIVFGPRSQPRSEATPGPPLSAPPTQLEVAGHNLISTVLDMLAARQEGR